MKMHGNIAKCEMLIKSGPMFRAFLFTDADANRKPKSVLWMVIPQRTVNRKCREELPIDP